MALVLAPRRRNNLPLQNNNRQLVAVRAPRARRRGRNAGILVVSNGANPRLQQLPAPRVQVQNPPGTGRRGRRGRVNGPGGGMTIGAAYSSVLAGGKPSWQGIPLGVRVSNSELFATMNGSTEFSASRWALAPALFPWVSGVAPNFSRFRWVRLAFEFITASPTSQGGSVAMGAGYDVMDNQPQSMAEISAMSHSQVVEVWNPAGSGCRVEYDCTRWEKPWYSTLPIPPTGIPPDDARAYQSYIPGWFYFGKATQVNGQTIGHIRVHYEIEFIDPIPISMNTALTAAELLARQPFALQSSWGADDSAKEAPRSAEELIIELAEVSEANNGQLASLLKALTLMAKASGVRFQDDDEDDDVGSPVTSPLAGRGKK